MNPQQLLVLAAALNAIGATKSNMEDMVPFRIVDLSKFDTTILPSRNVITQSETKPVMKRVQTHVQHRQPNGKTAVQKTGRKTVSQFVATTKETGTAKGGSVLYGSRVIKLTK